MIALGSKVKFTDIAFPEKQEVARDGGLFGPPVDINPDSTFTVTRINVQGDSDAELELRLSGFPWLVYADEVIVIS